jgi:hypothetical protein
VNELAKVSKFVEDRILPRIKPIREEDLITIDQYLEKKDPTKRKIYTKAYVDFVTGVDNRSFKTMNEHGLFVKKEFYENITDPRGIYTPNDLNKVLYGWLFSQIEEQFYDFPELVKHIPVRDRAAYITERLVGGDIFLETDFTSLESSISQLWMEKVEFMIYRHFYSQCRPETRELVEKCLTMLSSRVAVCTKHFKTSRIAGRSSGDMNTALGNAITNLILISYVFEKEGIPFSCVIEGDDGLIRCSKIPDLSVTAKLGFKITFDIASEMGELSFCGLKISPSKQVICDPFMSISKIGFIPAQYMNSRPYKKRTYLTMKALSSLFGNPTCPMVSAYARAVLNKNRYMVKKGTLEKLISTSHSSMYDKARQMQSLQYYDEKELEINMDTRIMFMKRYNIDVETQLWFEQSPLDERRKEYFRAVCPISFVNYTLKYCRPENLTVTKTDTIKFGYYEKSDDLKRIEPVEDILSSKEREKEARTVSKQLRESYKLCSQVVESWNNHPTIGLKNINLEKLLTFI